MVKAVIFDLDDTLISELDYIKSGYTHISEILSSIINDDPKKIFLELMELFVFSPQNVFNRILEKNNVNYSKEMIIELVNEYREHMPDIKFYNDVLSCLNILREKDIKVGIITDGHAISQKQKLKVINTDEYFDHIIVTDDLGKEFWKPHPKPFELMKDNMNVDFEQMIYIGDNPQKDFYISKTHPIKTIRIYRQGVYKDKEYLEGIRESYSIKNLSELVEIL